MAESNISSDRTIDQVSKVVGERDILPDILVDKLKDIKDWKDILNHQKLLKESLRRDISIQTALLDYLLSTESASQEAHLIELSSTEKVVYASIVDPLTGLYNDRHFQTITEAELKRARNYNLPLTLIILDADNFGMYTAIYGHESGDIALKEIARILKNNCRREDMLFRLMKNRFALLLLNIPRKGAHRLSARMRETVEKFHFKGEERMPVKRLTVSGGIAVYPEDGKNSQTLIMAAEEALTIAKESGKNRVLEYSVKRRGTPRIKLEAEARYYVKGRSDIKPQTVYIKNISESGVLLKAGSNLPLGGDVIMRIKLPGGISIEAKGRAVRISKKEGAAELSAAVKFTDIAEKDLKQLRVYMQDKIGK